MAHLWLEVPTPPGFSDEYALFRFSVGPQTDYGWLELDLGIDPYGYPIVTTVAYAYDTSGKPIPPATPIPEPQLPLWPSALSLWALWPARMAQTAPQHTAT